MPLDSTNWSQTETETKPAVFSLEGLIAWLETQPPKTKYEFVDNKDCLLCRYFRSRGIQVYGIDPYRIHRGNDFWVDTISYPFELNEIANGAIETVGAALSRARALLAETRK